VVLAREEVTVYRVPECMITGDVKEGRYDAGRLQEAQAAEVAIARELPVISEEHTSAYSKIPKENAKEEPAALMVVERPRAGGAVRRGRR